MIRIKTILKCIVVIYLGTSLHSLSGQNTQLKIKLLAQYTPDQNHIGYFKADSGRGNTSVDQSEKLSMKHSSLSKDDPEYGYFDSFGQEIAYMKRNRDLGQTFTYKGNKPAIMQALVLRTNWGSNAVRNGMYGQSVGLQIFEVKGNATLHQNGTVHGKAAHGYPHNRYDLHMDANRDDFLVGEIYEHLHFFSGAKFPGKSDFGFAETDSVYPDHPKLKGKYLRFEFPTSNPIILQPGKHYAFLVMIDKVGPHRAFALANNYYGTYEGGHGIRREGNGVFPPDKVNPYKTMQDSENIAAVMGARLPTDLKARLAQTPGTNGYPDVDTWRDLWFCVELKEVK